MATPAPTDRELHALKTLWTLGEASVRQMWRTLDPGDGTLPYTTVLSLMQAMEQKGLIGHRAEGKTYLYFARVERRGVFRQLAAGFLERVFDGAVDEYLVHALDSRRPSAEELDRLEQMIAAAKARSRRKRGKED